MLPTSLAVVLATVAMTLVPAFLLFWSWRRGFFHDLAAQSRIIFDERDWRIERPWESPADQLTREVAFGPLEKAWPGEWGDARHADRRRPHDGAHG
ncbi:MAG TPA: hypothetical protein VE861_15530 [Gemmatimonadaceae bacterium]|nr:hypothetical protein [Gemmatimonadaceae bacterium]